MVKSIANLKGELPIKIFDEKLNHKCARLLETGEQMKLCGMGIKTKSNKLQELPKLFSSEELSENCMDIADELMKVGQGRMKIY